MALTPGTRLGPYEILSPLGAGGMGEVYRARDVRLRREVAVKVLPGSLTADPEGLARFEREARAASALNHPNILTIHDVGTDPSAPYVVSELLEGETLRARLAAGPLPVRKALDFAIQITRGLAAAHERGIVHRDVKPENLFVTRDGRVKILDFGLAKWAAPRAEETGGASVATEVRTEAGVLLGTPGYLSPEQARGRAADARSDVFSFGAVLYEMLSGRRAFHGESAIETMNAILTEEPAPLRGATAEAAVLERVARRCLEKRPEERFQVARDLAFSLETLADLPASAARPAAPARADGRKSVAVLPFRDLAGDPESAYLGVGLADATITELALLRSLVVRPTSAVMRYQQGLVDPVEAGRELGVDAVAEGSFQRAGARVRVTLQLIEVPAGRPLWATKIDSSLEDVFQMQDDISRKIAGALQIELSPADERRMAAAGPLAGRAQEAYRKGRYHLLRETLEDVNLAIEAFEEARALDPTSALPLAALSEAYAYMGFSYDPDGGWYERAEELSERALALDANLPEGRYLRGRLLWTPRRGWDHAGAMREFAGAIAARPNLTEARVRLGTMLNHLSLGTESLREFDEALTIDPEDFGARVYRGLTLLTQARFEEALGVSENARTERPTSWLSYQIAECQIRLGLLDAAAVTVDRLSRHFAGDGRIHPLRGLLAAASGDRERALAEAERTERGRRDFGHFHHLEHDVACIYALLGDPERAIAKLEWAADNGFPCVDYFERDPLLGPVRGHARFRELTVRLSRGREEYRRLHAELRGAASGASGAAGA